MSRQERSSLGSHRDHGADRPRPSRTETIGRLAIQRCRISGADFSPPWQTACQDQLRRLRDEVRQRRDRARARDCSQAKRRSAWWPLLAHRRRRASAGGTTLALGGRDSLVEALAFARAGRSSKRPSREEEVSTRPEISSAADDNRSSRCRGDQGPARRAQRSEPEERIAVRRRIGGIRHRSPRVLV